MTESIRLEFILEASEQYFANWIADFTRTITQRQFPTQKGYFALQPARCSDGNLINYSLVTMEGAYVIPSGSDSEKIHYFLEIIRFKIIPLTANRSEIHAECNTPVVHRYFTYLLDEIVRRWPQPQAVNDKINLLQLSIQQIEQKVDIGNNQLNSIHVEISKISEDILHGRMEQGKIQRAIESIRKALIYIQSTGLEFPPKKQKDYKTTQKVMSSNLAMETKLELSIPITPLILNYKIELGTESNAELEAVVSELQTFFSSTNLIL